MIERTIVFVSDGTGITAETMGHSLATQFEDVRFRQVRIPFVDSVDKAHLAVKQINDIARATGIRPILFTTLVDAQLALIVHQANAFSLPFFATFVAPLEQELGVKSTHRVGRSHGSTESSSYKHRIEAINYTLSHDDGITNQDLEQADVILVGVSRCGKTPTSLYLAMQFGVKAANFPLIPEDFDRKKLPGSIERYRSKLFGLTIQPERLHQIRSERRPNSQYASLENCRHELREAEKMMRAESIRWIDSSTKSIEEISAKVMQETRIETELD